jgi:hypothetical protein
MDTIYSISKRQDGSWEMQNVRTKKGSGSYPNKLTALAAARELVGQGATVVVHAADGSIQQVLGVKEVIKKAPVKRRMSNKEVNKAIASVLNS